MAYFEKRANGWRAQIKRKGWQPVSKTFRTKSIAERWAREVEQEMDAGAWVEADQNAPITLSELLERYLKDVSSYKKGHKDEVYRMNKLIHDKIGQVPLTRLKPSMLAAWRDQRLKSVSPPTVRKDLAILNHAINVAMREWGVVLRVNPLSSVTWPAPGKPRDRRLNTAEYEKLMESLDQCRNLWIKPIVLFALETAMRRGEILSLTWQNINLEARTAFLPETKNGESRTVPLSQTAIDILENLAEESESVFNTTAYNRVRALILSLWGCRPSILRRRSDKMGFSWS